MARDVDLKVRVGLQDNTGKQLKHLESTIIRTIGAISAGLAALQIIIFPVRNATNFERAMADVAKTTGYADEDIQRLSESLIDMSKILGTSAEDLAQVAAIAGQLGLGDQGRKSIEAFTESVARASVTLGLAVDKTAEGGAQLSAIFSKSVQDVERVFSTINELSNNSVAAGGDLIDIMKRVGTTSGATFEQVAGLAATVRQLGVPNEQAGTGLVKYLGNLLAESKKFSEAMGIAQSEWVDKVKNNSVDALKYVLKELSKLGAAEQAALIKKLFGSGRLFALGDKLVGDAANGFKVLNKMLLLSAKGYDEGTSSIEEYNRIMDTTAKQLDVLKDSFVALGIKAGTKALPAIQRGIESLSETLQNEEVVVYFEALGEGLASIVEGVADAVRAVASLDVEWTNVIQAVKLFIGYKVGVALIAWALGIKKVVGWFGRMVARIEEANITLTRLRANFTGFQAQAAAMPATLTPIFTKGNVGNITLINAAAKQATKSVGLLATGMAIAGRAASALLGPAGFLALSAVSIVLTYREEILGFLGFVDAEAAARKRQAARLEREVQKKRREAIADAEETSKRMKLLIEDVQFDIKARLELDTEDANKDLKGLIVNFAQLRKSMDNSVAGMEAQRDTIRDGTKYISEYETEIEALQNRIAKLYANIELEKSKGANPDTSSIILINEKDIAAAESSIEQLRAKISTVQDSIEESTKAVNRYGKELKDAAKILALFRNAEISDVFDQQTKAYAEAILEYRRYTEQVSKIQDAIKKVQADVDRDPGNTALRKNLEGYQALLTKVENNTAAWKTKVAEVRKELKGTQVDMAKVLDSLSLDNLNSVVGGLKDVYVQPGNGITNYLRENADAILFNNIRLTKLNEAYADAKAAADAYGKSAQAAFDNTTNEIIAVRRNLAEFAVDFNNVLANRKATLKLDVKLGGINEEYDKAKQSINEYYDNLQKEAEKAGDEWYASQVEYARKAELADLDLQHTRDESSAKAKSQGAEFNRVLKSSLDLLKQAEEAAKAGNLDKALALKNQAKDSLKDAGDLLKEMSSLRTKNIFGDIKFKFSDAELTAFKDKLADTTKDIEGSIKGVNTEIRDTAIENQKNIAKVANDTARELEKSNRLVDLMRKSFVNFGQIMQKAQQSFANNTGKYGEIVNNLIDKVNKSPYDAVTTVDFGDIAKQMSPLEEGAMDAFSAGVFGGISEGLIEADSYARKKPLKIPVDIEKIDADFINKNLAGVEVPVIPVVNQEEMDKATQLAAHKAKRLQFGLDTDYIEGQSEDITLEPKVLIKASNMDVEGKLKILADGTVKAIKMATGGFVSGPGTTTSDSIPAWLSNGEFVIDAVTTKFFGSSFFSGLQNLARGGRSSRSLKRGLPAFANGGLVEQFSGAVAGSGNRDTVDVNFNIGNNSFKVISERDQVKGLVNALKYIQGTSK